MGMGEAQGPGGVVKILRRWMGPFLLMYHNKDYQTQNEEAKLRLTCCSALTCSVLG